MKLNLDFEAPIAEIEKMLNKLKSLPEHKNGVLDTQIQALEKVITDQDVYKRISNVNSLTLEITQDCNLRCRYCGYSGLYQSYRPHQSKRRHRGKRSAHPPCRRDPEVATQTSHHWRYSRNRKHSPPHRNQGIAVIWQSGYQRARNRRRVSICLGSGAVLIGGRWLLLSVLQKFVDE